MFEPYAAKAIVQHQWAAGTLSVWLTFRFPMNQLIKPLDTVWIVKVDGVVKAVASSAWQDAFTMLLSVNSITASPAEVKVKFDGPDSLLETTWHKNWEPWGYILSTDLTATFLPVGSIILWSGSIATIPTGWALCDGTLGTPNLTLKFILGACPAVPPGTNAAGVTHTHSFGGISHKHTLKAGTGVAAGTDFSSEVTDVIAGGTNSYAPSMPPYYALAYIMKL